MAKITLDTVAGGYDLSLINSNFDKIETEFQNKVLYRDNPVGETNTLQTDIDANSKRIFNLPTPTLSSEAARLQDIQGLMNGLSSLVQFTPYKNISSINLQEAIQEEIDDLESKSIGNGAALIGYSTEQITVKEALDARTPDILNYPVLRLYAGSDTAVYVRGFQNLLDGGNGVFRVDTSDTTSADNNGTIIVDSLGRRWKREFYGDIQAAWFGIKGDSSTDNTVNIQKAIDYAFSLGGGVIRFNAGTHLSGLIHLKTNVSLVGVAADHSGHLGGPTPGSCIKLKNSTHTVLLQIDKGQRACRIRDLTLDGNRTNNTGTSAVVAFESVAAVDFNTWAQDSNVIFERCTIWEGRGHGVIVAPIHRACKFKDCYIVSNSDVGLFIETSDVTVSDCLFGLNTTAGIWLAGAEATHIHGCDIFQGTYGIVVDESLYFGSPLKTRGALISNCGIDRAQSHGLLVGAGCWGISVSTCRFNGNSQAGSGISSHIFNNSTIAYSISVESTSFDDTVNAGAAWPKYDIELAASCISVVNGNLHTGRFVLGISNDTTRLRSHHGSSYNNLSGQAFVTRIENTGFTKLGSDGPTIKMKELTGTTSGSTGGTANIAHGLTQNNILSVAVLVTSAGGAFIPPRYVDTTLDYTHFISGTDVAVVNGASATNLLSRPIRILIVYKE